MRTFLRLLVPLGLVLSATAITPLSYADDPALPGDSSSVGTQAPSTDGSAGDPTGDPTDDSTADPSGDSTADPSGDPTGTDMAGTTGIDELGDTEETTTPPVLPVTHLDSRPANPTRVGYGTTVPSVFTFHSDLPGVTFRCKLTGPGQTGAWTVCASPKTYSALRGGTYTFTVHAVAADTVTVGPDTAYTWKVLSCANTATLCRIFAPDHYSVPAGATFNNPLSTVAAGRRNLTHVIRTINSMPGYRVPSQAVCDPKVYPSTIRITVYSATDLTFARALVAASRRCISVQILMNSHLNASNTSSIALLERNFGTTVRSGSTVRRSFAHRCHYGCRGGGVLHTKMYLFDSALTTPGGVRIAKTVMVGSSNMTANASKVQWNDLYTVRGNSTLHAQYLQMFARMATDRTQYRTYRYATGPYRTTFAPVTPGSVDPTLSALRSIHCLGAAPGTGSAGHSVVLINIHAFFGVRGYALANQLRAMRDRGCYVRVLYGFMSHSVYTKLTRGTGGVRMSVRRTIFSLGGNPRRANVYTHFKMIAASGYVGGDRSASVVWTGSNNFTNDGLRFDEVTMRIASRAAFSQYRNQFAFMTKRKSSAVYAVLLEPIGGGRAIPGA